MVRILSDHRRLMSPEGRNHALRYVCVTVAACPDDRELRPATEVKPPSERNHALTRFGTTPVGKKRIRTHNPDPPLIHRAPEGGANPLSGCLDTTHHRPKANAFAHACSTELTSNCV